MLFYFSITTFSAFPVTLFMRIYTPGCCGVTSSHYILKTTLTDAPDSFKTLADGSLVTGIESVVAQPSSLSPQRSAIYTIDGRCLGTSEKALPHGIYIIDGKKVVR